MAWRVAAVSLKIRGGDRGCLYCQTRTALDLRHDDFCSHSRSPPTFSAPDPARLLGFAAKKKERLANNKKNPCLWRCA